MKTSTARDLLIGTRSVHGGGRSLTSRDPVFRVDPAALAEWNAGTRRAVIANRDRAKREAFLDSLYYFGRSRSGATS
jgi:hypothetical protein